jgi:hypothetical protein
MAPDSSMITSLLAPAVSANPATPHETWQSVRLEVANGISRLLAEEGSPMDLALRKAMESLTDGDIRKLGDLFSDPTYVKFQHQLTSPAVQQQLQSGIGKAALQFGIVINQALASHQLHEIH